MRTKRIWKYCNSSADMQKMNAMILASQSPRRLALIHKIPRLNVAVFAPSGEEDFPEGLSADLAVQMLAERKAQNVMDRLNRFCDANRLQRDKDQLSLNNPSLEQAERLWRQQNAVILAADTMVTLPSGQILNKPKDKLEAEAMFRMLCGATHSVVTGYCLCSKTKIVVNFAKTHVTFGAFNDEIVYNYIKSGAPYDKAGGYGIQDLALAPLIVRLDGDKDNVVGLPVSEVLINLKEFFAWR